MSDNVLQALELIKKLNLPEIENLWQLVVSETRLYVVREEEEDVEIRLS